MYQNNSSVAAYLERVTRSFNDVVAISDISFSINTGSITGFLGPNGSGKTTSIKMLLGLIRPNHGQVRLFERDPFFDHEIKDIIGYVPEKEAFPKWITALDFITSLGRINLPREQAKKRARIVLEEVNLLDVSNKKIKEFSKGMKQRMKIAQALVHIPTLIIADEPFNGLDPIIRKDTFDLFKSYNEQYGSTFFISSHILFEVERLANQIVLLYKGRTIAQGSPIKIRELLQDLPHSIQIITRDAKKIAELTLQNGNKHLIESLEFGKDHISNLDQVIINTKHPRDFYHLLTDLVCDYELNIFDLRSTDEGLENLFKILTIE